MTTAAAAVKKALKLIGEIEAGEAPSAEDAADGLQSLNLMLHAWAAKGVDLIHIDLASGDSLFTDDMFHEGIIHNLAVKIAPEYGATVPPLVLGEAERSFAAFQAHTLEFDDDLKVDRALHPRYFNRRIGAYNVDEG